MSINIERKNLSTKDIDTVKFTNLIRLMKNINQSKIDQITSLYEKSKNRKDNFANIISILAKTHNALTQDSRLSLKNINPFDSLTDLQNNNNFNNFSRGSDFLITLYNTISNLEKFYEICSDILNHMRPGVLVTSKNFLSFEGAIENTETLQNILFETQINEPTVNRFLKSVLDAYKIQALCVNIAEKISQDLNQYYIGMKNRHANEGIDIAKNPIVTDVAMAVYENIISHGELENIKDPNQVSAYTINRGVAVIEAIKNKQIIDFIRTPGEFFDFIEKSLYDCRDFYIDIKKDISDITNMTANALGEIHYIDEQRLHNEFLMLAQNIQDLNPETISADSSYSKPLSKEEKYNFKFKNETISKITDMLLSNSVSPGEIVQYVISRKIELEKYFKEENSFYVCKISAGNPFKGSAPGELEVIPAERPIVDFNDIIGQGYDEIRQFTEESRNAHKWYDLFVATSPSKSGDKSNVLMLGPPGTGKSEVLRAIGSDKETIGIFAQGSDFLTCWRGEAEKNPKRLFEAAVKLHKESGKHVDILIDEIDSVLNTNHKESGYIDLSLEFQTLMDGVVYYPNISIWGTSNNPENIPMPMIRRFHKILMVGKLEQEDRVRLLKHYINFMPTKDIFNNNWEYFAKQLDGATGDIIRKVADLIWRSKMNEFVKTKPNQAAKMVDILKAEGSFNIAEFDNKQRQNFKNQLKQFVHVKPSDIEESINKILSNLAIRSEIETARETFENAEQFISSL